MKIVPYKSAPLPIISISTALCSALLAAAASQAAEFIPLGDLPGGQNFSAAYDLSADGKIVLGASGADAGLQVFRWSAEAGFQILPAFNPEAISGDGKVVVGSVQTHGMEAVQWSEATGLLALGVLPTQPGFAEFSAAFDTSADGSTIVGVGSTLDSPFSEALLWNPALGIVPLGFLPDDLPQVGAYSLSYANAVSADGQVVVGASISTKHTNRGAQAFRWTATSGMQPLGFLPGSVQSQATALSADGSVVAGLSGSEGFRWTESTGMQPIGVFLPTAMSAGGHLMVGRGYSEGAIVAFIWTAESGALPLQKWLEESHSLSLGGWQSLSDAVGISADGRIIAGTGVNSSGATEAFLVSLEAVTSASVSLSGSARLFIVDSSGRRFGSDPQTGENHSEIPEVTVTEANGVTTYSWPDLSDGTYHLVGTADGNYELKLNFTHGDGQISGQVLTSRLGSGGLHIISAEILADSAAGTRIIQTYADSDGDKVVDGSDAVLFSDLRPTVFIGTHNTGIVNKVLSNGASINDIIARLLSRSDAHSSFVSEVNKAAAQLSAASIISPSDKSKLTTAAAHFDNKKSPSANSINSLFKNARP